MLGCMGNGDCWRLGVAGALALLLSGCHSSGLPKTGTPAYLDEVTAFYVGLAALQVGDDVRADSTLERATTLAPGEPAGWANWGVLALRQGNFEPAAKGWRKRKSWRPRMIKSTICSGCSKANAAIPRKPSSSCAKPCSLIRKTRVPCICWRKSLSARAMPMARLSFNNYCKRFSPSSPTIQRFCWNWDGWQPNAAMRLRCIRFLPKLRPTRQTGPPKCSRNGPLCSLPQQDPIRGRPPFALPSFATP